MENAIKFGLYDTTGEIVISLKAEEIGNYLVVNVSNPFDPEMLLPRRNWFWFEISKEKIIPPFCKK